MKYLVTSQLGARPIPRELGVRLYQAAKEWLKARLAEGKLDCTYIFPDLSGGLAIANADSHEEVLDDLLDYPLYPFFDWEVTPVCDWSHSFDKLIEYFQKVAG